MPTAHRVIQMVEKSRAELWRVPEFVEPQISHYDFFKEVWYKTQHVYVRPELYELIENTPRYEIYDMPWYVDTILTYMGKSSFILTSRLCDALGKELAKCELLEVYVDIKEIKPVPIPDEIKQKFSPVISNEAVKFPTVPSPVRRVLTWVINPTQSQHDANLHVNNAFYPQYFQDCASYAADKNFYRQMPPPISKHQVLYFYVNYISQSDSTMTLLCQTWEDDKEHKTVYFRLTNSKNGTLIATAILKCGPEVKMQKIKHALANL